MLYLIYVPSPFIPIVSIVRCQPALNNRSEVSREDGECCSAATASFSPKEDKTFAHNPERGDKTLKCKAKS